MFQLMCLCGYISRNSLRAAPKNTKRTPFKAWIHSKTEPPSSSPQNDQVIKVVTRKKYKELPGVMKLPDGSNASALDEWPGGLEVTKVSLEDVLGVVPENSSSQVLSALQIECQEPPRKRRKTRPTKHQDAPLESAISSASDIFLGEEKPNHRSRRSNKKDKDKDSEIQAKPKHKVRNSAEAEVASPGNSADSVLENLPAAKLKVKLKKASKSRVDLPGTELDKNPEEISLIAKPKRPTRVRRVLSDLGNDQAQGSRRLPQNQLATEILENLAKFPHCILLTRVGNFYESYFDQAAEVARLLSIKLTKRTWDRQEVLMCGFPVIHLDRHLKSLVQNHKQCVAMCEEFRRTNSEEGFDRRVVRVLTPGTLIDESFLNPYENNYLLAVGALQTETAPDQATLDQGAHSGAFDALRRLTSSQAALGLAWIDVSTGEFFAQLSTLGGLRDDLARIGPREVVLHPDLKENPSHPIRLAVAEEGSFVSYISPSESGSSTPATIDLASRASHADDLVAVTSWAPEMPIKPVFTEHESSAISLLTAFLQANLLEHMPLLSPPARQGQQERMQIDSQTIKALEIREGMREGGTTGSLLSVVKRTTTSSGTRLLARWLCSPSTSVTEIRARQSLVALFYSRYHLREDLVQLLKRIEDASRIVQRFLLGKGDVEDLSDIKNAIEIWGEIKSRIHMERTMQAQERSKDDDEWVDLEGLLSKISDLQGLALRIGMAVDESGLRQQKGHPADDTGPESPPDVREALRIGKVAAKGLGQPKWSIKPDFSPELSSLHARLAEAETARQRLEQELQRRYDAPSLALRSSGNHGVHVHIGNSRRDLEKVERSPYFIPIASTGSTKSFFNQTWYLLGTSIIETIMKILAVEKNVFESLRREVNIEAGALRRNARIMDELDVTLGFANLAREMKFVRPVLNDSSSYLITNGRHPSVELGLLTSGRVFTPNTISLVPDSRLHIITGPNMAGKSTLLRQTALLAILAQTGSFVPADKAEIGIVDKLFSRVGAKDDLFRDRSTFMVEMLETAEILNRATEKSLVIMDEVGRGTTVKDGLAIAFATVCHLYTVNRCRALFATHFHEVVDMLGYIEGASTRGFFKDIGFFCTDVDETEDAHFAYSHRLRPGVNRDSHGLKVAQLGGMPPSAMRIAHKALDWMKARQGNWVADKEQLRATGEALVTGLDRFEA